MLNQETLERALLAAGLTAPARWDDETGSTNETALALAADGAPAWTVVGAGHQTAGRGRHGRTWVDRPGAALMCSVVLRPQWGPDRVGLVSLAAGAAMAEAVSEVAGVDVRCKWPNDLMAGEAKIGGILGEAKVSAEAIAYVVVGIGVNLDVPEGVPGAGAIGDVDEEALLSAFLRRLSSMLEGSMDAIVLRWRAVSQTLGRRVEATTTAGDVARGVAVDLDGTGALLIETRTGRARRRQRVRVAFGEIRHLAPLEKEPGAWDVLRRRGMFQRFTHDARIAIARAQLLADELGHDRIGPGHLLIAIAQGGSNAATRGLAAVRFDEARAREELVRRIEIAMNESGATRALRGSGGSDSGSMGHLDPAARKVFETSVRIALRFGHDWIGVEHLLLGLIELNDPDVASILVSQRIESGAVRDVVARGFGDVG